MRDTRRSSLSLFLLVSALGCEGLIDRLDTRPDRSGSTSNDDGTTQLGEADPDDDGATDPVFTPDDPIDLGGQAPTSPPPAPAAPDMTVTLETRIFTLVVGGSAQATAEFSWTTEGSDDATVVIQMKSSVTHPEWTPLLTGLPASDVGERYGLPLVRQTMWFRAVATHPAAPDSPAISNIQRFD